MPSSTSMDSAVSGNPVADGYGSLTAAAGTALNRLVPPRAGQRSKVKGAIHTAAATAHTLTFLTVQDSTTVTTDAASGQAVVAAAKTLEGTDGGAIAASDYCVVLYEDGTWAALKVSSVSGLNITFTASLAQKVKAGTTIFFMGAPGDFTNRQFTIDASTTLTLNLGGWLAVGTADGQPILASVDNITNAGIFKALTFEYGAA